MAPMAWQESVTPVQPPITAMPRLRDLEYAALVTGIWSGLLCLLVYGIARLAGVPFEVALPDGALQVVPWFMVLLLPVAAAAAGALIAALFRRIRFGGAIVLWGGTLIAAGSCIPLFLAPAEVWWSSRICLLAMHVITWFLVVPQIARIVGDSEPGKIRLSVD